MICIVILILQPSTTTVSPLCKSNPKISSGLLTQHISYSENSCDSAYNEKSLHSQPIKQEVEYIPGGNEGQNSTSHQSVRLFLSFNEI